MDDETRQRLEALEATLSGFPAALGELGRAVTFPSTAATKRLALELPGRSLVISSQANNHWGVNCRFDGVNWHRNDTSKGAYLLYIDQNDGNLRYLTVAAGANPITWGTSILAFGAGDNGWQSVGNYAPNWRRYTGVATVFEPQYRKLLGGMVILRGLVDKTVALALPEAMFTLPVGYRVGGLPGVVQIHPVATAAGYGEVRLDTSGGVQLVTAGAGANAWVSLGGIAFLAEN